MRLIVTRPLAQASSWVARLQALGVDAVALPLITIAPPLDEAPVHQAWARIAGCAAVVFVSPNAVQWFFDLAPAGSTWPPGTVAASTGPGTSAALRERGLAAQAIVEPAADAAQFDSEALWAQLAARPWAGQRVLIVRGEQGRSWLGDTFGAHGAVVNFVAAYRRQPPQLDATMQRLLAEASDSPADHCWHFSSSEAVQALQGLRPGLPWAATSAIATHPRIADTARRAGFGSVAQLGVHVEDVASWLVQQPLRVPPIQSGAP